MYTYDIWRWIAFFIIYCFIGWCVESLYVSFEHRKWVNRGFMNGPFLPIYGFGAIVMLFCALPFKTNLFYVFFAGMLGATVLEYFTGFLMEKIFHLKLWDYTYEILNLNGYICLGTSLMWGVFSVLLIKLIHAPVEQMVEFIGTKALYLIDGAFIVYFIWDVIISARATFDLNKIVEEQILKNEKIMRLQKRLDVIIAVTDDDVNKLQERIGEAKQNVQEKMAEYREELERLREESKYSARNKRRAISVLRRNPNAVSNKHDRIREILRDIVKK